jgi:hypothetical protein
MLVGIVARKRPEHHWQQGMEIHCAMGHMENGKRLVLQLRVHYLKEDKMLA